MAQGRRHHRIRRSGRLCRRGHIRSVNFELGKADYTHRRTKVILFGLVDSVRVLALQVVDRVDADILGLFTPISGRYR